MQKLRTKFPVNRAIEPRVITVHTQIAAGHLIIFAIYLHIETGITTSFEVPVILFGTLHGDVLPISVSNVADLRGRKSIYKCIFYFYLERRLALQRS